MSPRRRRRRGTRGPGPWTAAHCHRDRGRAPAAPGQRLAQSCERPHGGRCWDAHHAVGGWCWDVHLAHGGASAEMCVRRPLLKLRIRRRVLVCIRRRSKPNPTTSIKRPEFERNPPMVPAALSAPQYLLFVGCCALAGCSAAARSSHCTERICVRTTITFRFNVHMYVCHHQRQARLVRTLFMNVTL